VVPGDVYKFNDFPLPNGEKKTKLLVVLSTIINQGYVVTTTSQGHHYTQLVGCQGQGTLYHAFQIENNQDVFIKDTWIQFTQGVPVDIHQFDNVVNNTSVVQHIGNIGVELFNDVLNCGLQCQDIPIRFKEEIRQFLSD